MALSTWATMALDSDGNANSSLESFHGIEAEIYKNWIYLRSKKMWVPGGGFTEPVIASIDHGDLRIHDLDLKIARCELQQAVFIYAESSDFREKKAKWMAGIGCYGYDDSEWVGVTESTASRFYTWLTNKLPERSYTNGATKAWVEELKAKTRHFNQGDAFFEAHGFGEKPMTEVGQAPEEPVMSKIIKGMKE